MFKNSYQRGLFSIFYSCGANPLAIWDMEVKNGHIKRLTDNEVNSIVLEIVSANVATTYIKCPKNNQVLGIKLPFLVMIVKNLKRYFSFEITILDDKNMRRRFRISNFQSTTKIKPFCTSMPIGLAGGWNQIQFNLADFTRRAYGTQFIETLRVQVNANARLRRIYFSERLYTEEELPQDYKLYLPLDRKSKKGKPEKKEHAAAQSAVSAVPPVTEAPVLPLEAKISMTKTNDATPTPASAEPEPDLVKPEELAETIEMEVVPEEAPVGEPVEEGGESGPGEVGGEEPTAPSEATAEAGGEESAAAGEVTEVPAEAVESSGAADIGPSEAAATEETPETEAQAATEATEEAAEEN